MTEETGFADETTRGAAPHLTGTDGGGDGFERRMVTRAALIGALAEVSRNDLVDFAVGLAKPSEIADAILAALPFAEPLTRPEAWWMVSVGKARLAEPDGVSLGEQPHDPAHCDRDGRPHLGPCVDPSAEPDPAAADLLSLAAEFDRLADVHGGRLVREATIRGATFRRAAQMARARATGGHTGPGASGAVELDPGDVQGATEAYSGSELIAAERQRQISAEGWTAEHDAHHADGELALAAACYALPRQARPSSTGLLTPAIWPWRTRDWKPAPGDRVRELVKAGALICAEIDRLIAAGEVSP